MIGKLVIDATNGTVGRIVSYAAKQSLLGKEVFVVNCGEALITGRKGKIVEDYKQKIARGGSAQKGPYYPRSPEMIIKRVVHGMLSYDQGRGRDALKRIKCYNDVPEELKKDEQISLAREIKFKAIKLNKLCEIL